MTKICTRLLALLVFLPMLGFGQVAYQLSPVPHQQFGDTNGKPLAGGFIYTYSAGSSTPLATYKDNIGTANTNPIVLDAGGFATIYLGQNSYKFCVQNSSAVQQWCQDNVQNISQVLLTTANTWTLGQTFNSLINFLGGTSDTTAAEGNFFYRTDLHRGRWYDSGAAAWHSIVGADSTDTLSNKSLAGTTPFKRFQASLGTTLVTGDWALGGNWGTSPSLTAATGTDMAGAISINVGSGSPGANPTIALTFHDGAWASMPNCSATPGGGLTAGQFWSITGRTTTVLTFTFNGTPTTSGLIGLNFICIG